MLKFQYQRQPKLQINSRKKKHKRKMNLDLYIFYKQILLLTTRINFLLMSCIAFNMCFHVFRSCTWVEVIWCKNTHFKRHLVHFRENDKKLIVTFRCHDHTSQDLKEDAQDYHDDSERMFKMTNSGFRRITNASGGIIGQSPHMEGIFMTSYMLSYYT